MGGGIGGLDDQLPLIVLTQKKFYAFFRGNTPLKFKRLSFKLLAPKCEEVKNYFFIFFTHSILSGFGARTEPTNLVSNPKNRHHITFAAMEID